MKIQNKNSKKYRNNESIDTSNKMYSRKFKKTLGLNSKWQIIYDRKYQKYKLIKKQVTLDEYLFYSVLNTAVAMELGVAASLVARSILALYNKLVADRTKNPYINQWQKSGESIIVLRGYNHKHLKYLERQVEFTALGKHVIYHRWYHNSIILALSVFGRKEEIQDIFDGLSYLR